jgi:hypothetical protein
MRAVLPNPMQEQQLGCREVKTGAMTILGRDAGQDQKRLRVSCRQSATQPYQGTKKTGGTSQYLSCRPTS